MSFSTYSDFKDPNGPAAAAHKTPKQLPGEIEDREHQIASLVEEMKNPQ